MVRKASMMSNSANIMPSLESSDSGAQYYESVRIMYKLLVGVVSLSLFGGNFVLAKFGDPQLSERFERSVSSSSLENNNSSESPFNDLLRKYLHSRDCKNAAVQTDLKSLIILSWTQLQALVEMYAKDESKRTEMLKCPHPSQHLLEVEETMDTLSPGSAPEPSFHLTGSEFGTIVEGLASEEQKLTSFERLLDLGKDFAAGNDLPLQQRAEKAVIHYQHMPESSVEKLLSALYDVGLSLPAKTISLSKKQ